MDYILYIGIASIIIGVYQLLRDYYASTKGDTIVGTIIRCKNKTRKGRSYSYPKVEFEDSGFEKSFYCYDAKMTGHNRFVEGETITLYKYRNFLSRVKYTTLLRAYRGGAITFVIGIGMLVYSQFFI